MHILVSGSTGLMGTSVIPALKAQGHTIARLLRPSSRLAPLGAAGDSAVEWDPASGRFDSAAAEGADALVHLAGASIAGGRWTRSRKTILRTSRIDATRHLVAALAGLHRPPRVVVAASAIGFYGNRGEELLTETSKPGDDFLATLCHDWEAESARATQFGARTVMLRFGIILAKHGGALPRMALPFRFGAGGPVGSGRQWMSWLSLDDAVGVVGFALSNAALAGPVNAVSANPARNADFARAISKVLHRPAFIPAPAFALRLVLGELADGLLLSSQRVVPTSLERAGYEFRYAELGGSLAHVLSPPGRT